MAYMPSRVEKALLLLLKKKQPYTISLHWKGAVSYTHLNGSAHLIRFTLNEKERKELDTITEALENEFTVSDSLQEEMLRILLKRCLLYTSSQTAGTFCRLSENNISDRLQVDGKEVAYIIIFTHILCR